VVCRRRPTGPCAGELRRIDRDARRPAASSKRPQWPGRTGKPAR
jgi:hypothetical protein